MARQRTLWKDSEIPKKPDILSQLLYLGQGGRIISSARARRILVEQELLTDDPKGIQRLYRVLNSERFVRVSHGKYRLNEFYTEKPELPPDLERRLRFMRGR